MDLLNVKVNNEWVPLPAFVGPKGDQGEKGDTGDSGVYYGENEPVDPDVDIWIDPSGTDTFDETIKVVIDNWLDDHPEATTTVEDGAITRAKLDEDLKSKTDDVLQIKNSLVDKAPVIINNVKGNPCVFSAGLPGLLMDKFQVNFLPKQSGTGDPSPTNIRPFSGWTGINAWHGSDNLFDKHNVINGYFSSSGGTTKITSATGGRTVWCPCEPDTIYTCTKMQGGQRFSIYCTETEPAIGTDVLSVTSVVSKGYYHKVVKTPLNAHYICLFVWLSTADTTISAQNMIDSVHVEAGNIIPYTASWTSFGTIYGGYIDLIAGQLWKTYDIIASYSGETIPSVWASDRDVYISGAIPTTGAQVVYKLAEPILVVTFTPAEINTFSGINTVWSDTNDNCNVEYHAETKAYVDEHQPNIIEYWSDHIYALPEYFGAAGDGVADDTEALIKCIDYSATSGKPVRGYGKYKISNTLLLKTRYQDVYLRYVVNTSNNAAIQLAEQYITLGFDVIESNGIGILFQQYTSSLCAHNKVIGNMIYTVGHCIKAGETTYYMTIDVRQMNSTSGDCINADFSAERTNSSEYVIRDCSFACAVGWVAYKPFGYKFYGCTVESNCKNGYYNPMNCSFFGCRHREFTDCVWRRIFSGEADKTNGPLFKFVSFPSYLGLHGNRYITGDYIPWCSIDVSEIQGYDTITYTSSKDIDIWGKLAYSGIDMGVTVKGLHGHAKEVIGNECYFIGNNKVFVPKSRTTYIFDKATYHMNLFEGQTDQDILDAYNQWGWGTDFVTGYSHTDYYMNASFGAIGYNDLTITQQNGNTCTIYDKLGNVLFDGTNAGNGKWRLYCNIDRTSYGRLLNVPSFTQGIWWCYDGTNETWQITKLE